MLRVVVPHPQAAPAAAALLDEAEASGLLGGRGDASQSHLVQLDTPLLASDGQRGCGDRRPNEGRKILIEVGCAGLKIRAKTSVGAEGE